MAKRYLLVCVVVVSALALGACATARTEPSSGQAEVDERSEQGRPPLAVLDEADTVDGADFSAAQLAGQPVVLWFWAPWCGVCRAEGPEVARVAAALEGDVTFVGVAGLGEVEDMRGFVSDTGTAGLTHLVDRDGAMWTEFGVIAQPAFAFVSADGEVEVFQGALPPADLTAAARELAAG